MCIFSHYWKEEDILLNFQFWAINNFYLRCLQRLGIAMPNPRAYVQIFPEEALQFAWSRIWVNLVQHSRWQCSNLEFVPGTLQLYNPFTRFVLVYIFFKAKYTSHPSKQDINVFHQEQTLLFASHRRCQLKQDPAEESTLRTSDSSLALQMKIHPAHWGDVAFLGSKHHCPLHWTLKIITFKQTSKQSRLFSVLKFA